MLVLLPEGPGGVLCDPVLLHHDPQQRVLRLLRLPRLGELQINSKNHNNRLRDVLLIVLNCAVFCLLIKLIFEYNFVHI